MTNDTGFDLGQLAGLREWQRSNSGDNSERLGRMRRRLPDAMAELMDHPEEVSIMREKALETYQSRFTGEVFARNTEQIYENVLKGASK